MRTITLIAVLAAVLAFGACKKKGEEGGGGAAAAPPPSPAVDCPKLQAKVQECGDAFWTAWDATEQGKNSAKEFKTYLVSPDMGAQLCKDNWGQKDNRWNARYNACWETPDCAVWGPCAANALGNLLPVPGT
ncbi:MAG: hypothetical protein HY905_01425 [Deltaproteobacteria bacterium]|nr:hypothetical protein [Deltaproteobacteria bacterium]